MYRLNEQAIKDKMLALCILITDNAGSTSTRLLIIIMHSVVRGPGLGLGWSVHLTKTR